MANTIKSCVFDLDGTLLDTIPAIFHTCNLALQELSLPPLESRGLVPFFAGDGAGKLMERALQHILGKAPEPALLDDALKRYLAHFKDTCMFGVAPYTTMPELLSGLLSRGITLAVVTNKPQPMAEKNILEFFPPNTFGIIVGARDGLPLKPAPDGALLAARHLGSTPQECLYIGDTDTDMRTGAAAGMHLCGALWGFRERAELEAFNPEFLAEKPIDILEMIK